MKIGRGCGRARGYFGGDEDGRKRWVFGRYYFVEGGGGGGRVEVEDLICEVVGGVVEGSVFGDNFFERF